MSERKISLPQVRDMEYLCNHIGDFIVKQCLDHGSTGGVIGLSGGVDSTSVAALAHYGFSRYNSSVGQQKLELVGYMLPSKTNALADTSDGEKVAQRLGIRYDIISIEPLLEEFRKYTPKAFVHGYDKGNVASRLRANILSTMGATENKSVIGTGNKDEDFGVGYYTLFGDGAVHFSPIGLCPKRIVREIAAYLGFPDLANRIPTAGLEPNQTDFGDLGYRYETVELITGGLEQGLTREELLGHSVVHTYALHDMKLYTRDFGKPKFTRVEDLVQDIFRRNHIAGEKAKIINPPKPTMEGCFDYVWADSSWR